jgi:hypothetical protein
VESGINWLDTAAVYELGHSEEVVLASTALPSPTPASASPGERRYDPHQ